jgi:WD40 repeat protein
MPGGQPLGRVLVGPLATSSGSLSDDGRLAVTYAAGNPQTGVPVRSPIHIWNVAESRIVKTLPPAAVFESAISPDDSRLFLRVQGSGIPNGIGQAEILTLATGRTVPLQTVTPCGYFPNEIEFSANDAEVAGESFCGIVDVWSARTGRLLRAVNELGQVSGVGLSPNGSLLAVSSWDSRATIWNVASGHQLQTLVGHTRGLNGIAFAGNGSLVVTTSLDDTVRVWDALDGKQLRARLRQLPGLPVREPRRLARGRRRERASPGPGGRRPRLRHLPGLPEREGAAAPGGAAHPAEEALDDARADRRGQR